MDRILLVGVIQSLFAGSIILFKRDRLKHESILGVWLIIIAVQLELEMLGYFWPDVRLFRFGMSWLPMLQGPFILLYTRYLTSENPQLSKKDLLHFLPLLYGTILFFILHKYSSIFRLPYAEMSGGSRVILSSYMVNSILINIIYIYFALRLIRRFKVGLEDRFSVSDARNSLIWLRFVQLISLLVPIFWVLSSLIYMGHIKLPVDPRLPVNLFLTLLSFVLGYFGYRQGSIFPVGLSRSLEKVETSDKAYERSGLSAEDEVALMNRIDLYVKDTKAYIDSDLTIYKLGKFLEVPHYHITQTINRVEGKNFYTYINEQRIAEVKLRLEDDRADRFTLLALALDCGFNSKTTFNTVFKKLEGKTPSQYKAGLENKV